MTTHRPPGLRAVLAVNFVDSFGFSIVLPFMVFVVTRMGGSAAIYGVVTAIYPACQFLGAPILGRLSDRVGRRPVLLISQAGTLASWLLFGLALLVPPGPGLAYDHDWFGEGSLTLPLAFVALSRAVDGFTGGNVSVANAYLADISSAENRDRHFAWMGMTFNAGLVAGPALSGLLSTGPAQELPSVVLAIAVSTVAMALIALRLPESKRRRPKAPVDHRDACAHTLGREPRDGRLAHTAQRSGRQALLALPGLWPMLWIHFTVMLGFNLFYAAFPLHATTVMEWSVTDVGWLLTTLSIALVVVEGPVLSRLERRTQAWTRVIVGMTILAAGLATFQGASTPYAYAGALLFALGDGIMWPTLSALLASSFAAEHQGAVQGMAGSAGSLASILGLVAGGLAYESVGGATFVAAAAATGVAALLALGVARRTPLPSA